MNFDCEERVRRAVRLRAAKRGIGPSDVINEALEQFLPEELREAEKILREEQKKKGSE